MHKKILKLYSFLNENNLNKEAGDLIKSSSIPNFKQEVYDEALRFYELKIIQEMAEAIEGFYDDDYIHEDEEAFEKIKPELERFLESIQRYLIDIDYYEIDITLDKISEPIRSVLEKTEKVKYLTSNNPNAVILKIKFYEFDDPEDDSLGEHLSSFDSYIDNDFGMDESRIAVKIKEQYDIRKELLKGASPENLKRAHAGYIASTLYHEIFHAFQDLALSCGIRYGFPKIEKKKEFPVDKFTKVKMVPFDDYGHITDPQKKRRLDRYIHSGTDFITEDTPTFPVKPRHRSRGITSGDIVTEDRVEHVIRPIELYPNAISDIVYFMDFLEYELEDGNNIAQISNANFNYFQTLDDRDLDKELNELFELFKEFPSDTKEYVADLKEEDRVKGEEVLKRYHKFIFKNLKQIVNHFPKWFKESENNLVNLVVVRKLRKRMLDYLDLAIKHKRGDLHSLFSSWLEKHKDEFDLSDLYEAQFFNQYQERLSTLKEL